MGKLHKFFPTAATNTIILSIDLSLYPIALKYIIGNASSPTYGQLDNWIMAFVTLAAVLFFSLMCEGMVEMTSILLGAMVGCVLTLRMGVVHFDGVVSTNWLAVPKPFFHDMPSFGLFVVLPILLVTIVNIMQSVGDITGATVRGFDRKPRSEGLTEGVTTSGITTLVGIIFDVPVVSSLNQNVNIMSMDKVISRRVTTTARAIMLALDIVPKLSALASTLPAPVINGGTLIVFGMITLTGLELVLSEPLTAHGGTIVGVSIALAMGSSTLEGTAALESFSPLAQALFSKPVVVAGVMSFLLGLLAPGGTVDEEARERAALDAE